MQTQVDSFPMRGKSVVGEVGGSSNIGSPRRNIGSKRTNLDGNAFTDVRFNGQHEMVGDDKSSGGTGATQCKSLHIGSGGAGGVGGVLFFLFLLLQCFKLFQCFVGTSGTGRLAELP